MAFRGTQPFLDDTKGRPSRSFWSLWDFKTEPSASARTHEMKEPPREKGIGSGSYKVNPFLVRQVVGTKGSHDAARGDYFGFSGDLLAAGVTPAPLGVLGLCLAATAMVVLGCQ